MIDKIHTEIAYAARQDAERKRNDAAGGGSMHDGGAGQLEAVVDAWVAGLEGKIPKQLQSYADQVKIESDPEYAEYLRLKDKFK